MNFYKHYLELKKQHETELLFYRVGDFYELFGADAVKASKVLDLTLTGRDVGGERVSMCGVPYHSVDSYVAKFIEQGCKVALCEPSTQIPKAENEPIKAQGRLNLTANGTEQTILLEYLEANASDVLVDKINNGVRIQKDGKMLINKKTLETFMKYACDEAQKLAEKGARAAAVKSDTVFGWLIHYFEESSIEGTLYNEDGSEYKPPKPVSKTSNKTAAVAVVTPPKEKPKAQFSLFDMLDQSAPAAEPKEETADSENDEPEDDEFTSEQDDTAEPADEDCEDDEDDIPKGLHQISETAWADADGVIYEEVETKKDTIPDSLTKLFGDLLVAR